MSILLTSTSAILLTSAGRRQSTLEEFGFKFKKKINDLKTFTEPPVVLCSETESEETESEKTETEETEIERIDSEETETEKLEPEKIESENSEISPLYRIYLSKPETDEKILNAPFCTDPTFRFNY